MADRRPALFLDRDGVLNVDRGYVSRVEDFEWVDGARECVANFNRRGWFVFVVTNQSGIARGLYTEADMHTLHAHMEAELEAAGAHEVHHDYASLNTGLDRFAEEILGRHGTEPAA